MPDDDALPAHLALSRSDRGFARLPELPDDYGAPDAVSVYESSNIKPSIWLAVKQTWYRDLDEHLMPVGPEVIREATVHLSVDTARKLRDQLDLLLAHVEATP